MQQKRLKINSQQEIAPRTFELILSGADTFDYQPGQFVMVQIPDAAYLLRRPFGIAAVDSKTAQLHLIYRVVGGGTQLLSHCLNGQEIAIFGPLGKGFPTAFLQAKQQALVIAGGIGIAPLLGLLNKLAHQGIAATLVFGAKTKADFFHQSKLEKLAKVYYVTEDGSFGFRGNADRLIEAKLAQHHYQAVYACGPAGLLRAVARRYQKQAHVYCAVERPLACGIGECYACVIPARQHSGDYKVCEDGPVFSSKQVVF